MLSGTGCETASRYSCTIRISHLCHIQSSIHFAGAFTLMDQTPSPGAVAPLTLPSGPVLWVSVPSRRGAREAGWRPAAPLQCPALAELLAGGGGA